MHGFCGEQEAAQDLFGVSGIAAAGKAIQIFAQMAEEAFGQVGGTQTVTPAGTLISQIGTLLYFAFFLLMPWYSVMDKTQPEPDRVTM